jgi:hypothetical protein
MEQTEFEALFGSIEHQHGTGLRDIVATLTDRESQLDNRENGPAGRHQYPFTLLQEGDIPREVITSHAP